MNITNDAAVVAQAVDERKLPCECDVRFCHRPTSGIVFYTNPHSKQREYIAICELHYEALLWAKRFPWENKADSERRYLDG
jgi:hypothetical protein